MKKSARKGRKQLTLSYELGEQAEKYLSLLPDGGDPVLVVLKGHLVIEELLHQVLTQHFADPKRVADARLRFSQLASLVRGLGPTELLDDDVWGAVAALNALRNAYAHRLSPSNTDTYVKELRRFHDAFAKELPQLLEPKSDADMLKICVALIMGALSMLQVLPSMLATAMSTAKKPSTQGHR